MTKKDLPRLLKRVSAIAEPFVGSIGSGDVRPIAVLIPRFARLCKQYGGVVAVRAALAEVTPADIAAAVKLGGFQEAIEAFLAFLNSPAGQALIMLLLSLLAG